MNQIDFGHFFSTLPNDQWVHKAAKAYDTYVILNNLEHTINGVLHEPIKQQTS